MIEDAKVTSKAVQNLLSNCGVVFTLLNEATPVDEKLDVNKDQKKWWTKPRGVHQRNAGLHWLRDAFRYRKKVPLKNRTISINSNFTKK